MATPAVPLASQPLDVLRRRLTELGVPDAAYRIGEPAPRTWYIEQVDDGWEAGWYESEDSSPMLFDDVKDAAAFLLGKLLIEGPGGPQPTAPAATAPTSGPGQSGGGDPNAPTRVAEPVKAPASEWPIQPMRGEPPLSLFKGKQMIELAPGTEIDRFGGPDGNLAYAAGTPFAQRSLVPDWKTRPYHVYQVRRPLRALSGRAIPWFDQPGGGIAYLLPGAVAELVNSGDLAEIEVTARPD